MIKNTRRLLNPRTLRQLNGSPAAFSTVKSERLDGMGESVFAEFSTLCTQFGATNLGQGFPNYPPPEFVKESLLQAANDGMVSNQYTRSQGHPKLAEQLVKLYSSLTQRQLNMQNFVVTSGATDALFTTAMSFLNHGDEVIVMEPFYDAYPAQAQMAGATTKYIPLQFPTKCTSSGEWVLDFEELDKMITDKTKLLYINNPHNPTGKVWTREELTELAAVVLRHPQLNVVSDEAYEWLVFDNNEHIRLCTIPGMWDRTITVCSAGKSFECTGWKIGWIMADEKFTSAFQLAHQWVPFCVSTPLQYAIALSLEKAEKINWFDTLKTKLQSRRDGLVDALRQVNLEPIVPQGGYFVLADTSAFTFPRTEGSPRDFDFTRWLIKTWGVGPIPPSAFYSPEHAHMVENIARFAICKSDDLIEEGVQKLMKIK